MERGADINAPTHVLRSTPVMLAALMGNVEILRELRQYDIDFSLRNQKGQSPLHIAAIYGNLEAMEELCSWGYSLNERDQSGNTPMHSVAKHLSWARLEDFRRLGGDISIRNNDGFLPLDMNPEERKQCCDRKAIATIAVLYVVSAVSYYTLKRFIK